MSMTGLSESESEKSGLGLCLVLVLISNCIVVTLDKLSSPGPKPSLGLTLKFHGPPLYNPI